MHRFAAIIFICILLFDPRRSPPKIFSEAHAIGPAIAAPAVAIGALELTSIAVATAATIGVISVSQNKDFQQQISQMIEKIKNSTADIISATITESNKLVQMVSNQMAGCKTSGAKQSQRGATCSSSADSCCGDYFNKFGDRLEKGRGGIKIFKNNRHNKLSCCLEWDNTHGGFEIFDEHGHHMGERGCDDLSDDPCAFTKSRGLHAKPADSTHHPRSPVCDR